MKKIAIVTDSNSGITQAQAAELGIHVIPMPFIMDGVEYFEDITLTQEQFYEKLLTDADISTSQPSPGSVLSLWDELLLEHEQIVHIPMSSGLSFSCSTAMALAEEYGGRVHVADNHRISVTQRQAVLDAIKLAENGMPALEIKEYLERTKEESSIYIMLDTLKYLKKGGRLTPAAAAIGSILRIKPLLQIQGGKLDAFAKVSTKKQGRAMLIDAMRNDFETRFSSLRMTLQVAYSYDEVSALDFVEEVQSVFPEYEVHTATLPLSVACHIGPGGLGLTCASEAHQ